MTNKSVILGYGATGKSFERFLISKNTEFVLYDEFFDEGDKSEISGMPFINFNSLQKYNSFFVSPGFSKSKLDQLGVLEKKIITDIDIFSELNNSFKIAITGTNGKSSLTHYLTQILNHTASAISLGNFGNPLPDYINHQAKYSVIELSSFQLEKMTINNFDLSVITNISRDHIDYHGTFENYKLSKLNILNSRAGTFFYNNSGSLKDFAFKIAGKIEENINQDLLLEDLPFRLQQIGKNIYNDSKSTNSASLLYAIKELDFSGKLIMCGNPLKEDYRDFPIHGPSQILIFGTHKNDIKKRIIHPNIKTFDTFDDLISSLTKEDRILFSPGNPSGKDFNNFIERGAYFSKKIGEYFGS